MSYKLGGVTWNDDGTMATDELTSLEALDKILHYIEKQYGEKVEKLVFTKSDKVFEIDTLRKELKALEIIKEKGLSLLHKSLIINSKNYKEYRQEFQLVKSRELKNEYFYSQQEFDLLKEILL